MNKTSQHNYSSTLVRFLEESPIKNPMQMAEILFTLHRYETSLNRYYCVACERELTASEEKRIANIEEKVKVLAATLEFDYFLNGDPRGYAIRFILPSKKYNSWDGESWALNW